MANVFNIQDLSEDILDDVLQPLAAQYFTVVTSLSDESKRRINRCIAVLSYAGVLTNLVDACFLRPGQNTGNNSPRTLIGGTGTLSGSPFWQPDGVFFDGTGSQNGSFPVSDTKPFTMVAECKGVDAGQIANGTLFGMTNSAGGTTAAQICELSGTDGAFVYSRQNGFAPTTSTPFTDQGSSTTIHYYNPLLQVNSISYDNAGSPTINMWVDGLLGITDNTGMTQSTSALNLVTIGARFLTSPSTWDTPYRGNIACWLLFNKVLSTAENAAVVQAIRHLDARPSNIVVLGDSTSCQLSDSTRAGANWPLQLQRTADVIQSSRLYNQAINGALASGLDDNFSTRVAPFVANGTSVKESWLYVLAGINDLLASASAATVFANLQAIWRLGRASGFRMVAFTIQPTVTNVGTGLTSAQDAQRVSLNTSIRGATSEYDAIVDLDLMFGGVDGGTSVRISQIVAATSTITTDAVHRRKIGDRIQFTTAQSGILANTDYFVKTVPSTTTMTVSATKTNTTIGATQTLTPDFGPGSGPVMNLPQQFMLDALHPNNDGYKAIAQLAAVGAPAKRTQPKVIELLDAATIAVDCNYAGDGLITFNVKLAGNRTLGNPTNALHGQRIRIRFTQDATGSRTLTTNAAGSKWVPGPFTLTLTTTANLSDYLEAEYDAQRDVWDVLSFVKGF